MLPELLCNSGFLRTCELSIERTACYSDEEMQGFVNACEQLFLNTGQEFFLPILMKESSEQQDLVRNLKLTPRKTCKSLRMFSKEELLGERGSKVSKNNDKIEPAPDPDGLQAATVTEIIGPVSDIYSIGVANQASKLHLLQKCHLERIYRNGHDCGVYVIKFMLAPEEVTNPDFVFDSENERLEVVLRLLASDVNSCRNGLASKAESYYEQSKEGKPDSSLVSIDVRFDSHGMQMSKYLENADDPSKCISFAKRHRIKENYMSDLLCCEKAFVPVFDKDRSHFFLFVLQLKTQVVEIWDSLAASCQSDWVDRRLHNLFMLAPEEVTNPDFVFDSDTERLEVVLRLLASDVNSCRNDLASQAEAYYEQSIIGTDIKWEYGKQSSGCTFLWVVEISG
ncbi:hypothetical protein D5086_030057 [Populus alba]|uniref:Uncharacterized protein n=1 Tax=Populus alba TaxID=43335 RepID=A0ACC4AN21_POPAL